MTDKQREGWLSQERKAELFDHVMDSAWGEYLDHLYPQYSFSVDYIREMRELVEPLFFTIVQSMVEARNKEFEADEQREERNADATQPKERS